MTLTEEEEKDLKAIVDTIELTEEQGEALMNYITDYLNRWKVKIELKIREEVKREMKHLGRPARKRKKE